MAAMIDSARDNEFTFSGADFERVRKLIYQRAGISLHAGKQAMVYSRLSRRLRETGHRSFGEYLQWLERATGAQADSEWQEFVNCLTTNLTAFFREEHHFHALVTDLRARRTEPHPHGQTRHAGARRPARGLRAGTRRPHVGDLRHAPGRPRESRRLEDARALTTGGSSPEWDEGSWDSHRGGDERGPQQRRPPPAPIRKSPPRGATPKSRDATAR